MPKSMLIDLTKCNGCNACTQACKVANNVPKGVFRSKLISRESGVFPKTKATFLKSACKHCEKPACVAVCPVTPVKALAKNADGAVVFDDAKCIGCRACSAACPFKIPDYGIKEGKTIAVINKCDFCVARLDGGTGPACAEACPFGALEVGERSAMLELAYARIKKRPDAYLNAVYGEKEVGGTSMLYISNVPFEDAGLPKLGPEPRALKSDLPTLPLDLGSGLALAGLVGVIRWRSNRMQAIREMDED